MFIYMQFCFESNTIRVMKIDKLVLKLAADKELIGETFRHYLNPFEVEVIGAKDVPLQTNDKYLPAYVKYTFFDGMTVETNAVVGNDKLLWSHRHVFLAGLINPSELTESLRSKYLKFELHDRD